MKIGILLFFMLTLLVTCKKDQETSLVELYVPTIFYPGSPVDCPDGDPECNRGFKVKVNVNTLMYLKSFELNVYSKDGTRVYFSTDYTKAWEGNYSAEPLTGTTPFTYLIRYTDTNNHTVYKEGTVLMVR